MRVIAFVFLVACSGSQPEQAAEDPGPRSGFAEDALIRQLSPAEQGQLCAWWGETLGVGRMQSCSECSDGSCIDWDVAVSTQSDCVEWISNLQCDVTVRDAEDCAFAQKPDLCASPTACDPFDGC